MVPNAITLAVLPEELKAAAVSVKSFKLSVPLVNVTVLVEPSVNAPASTNVPPTPLKVIGKSSVLPFVVMVAVPVSPNVVTLVPAEYVPPEAGIVKSPKIVLVVLLNVPVNPVKLTVLKLPVNATISVALGLNTIPVVPLVDTLYPAACASVKPVTMVRVPVEPVYVAFI